MARGATILGRPLRPFALGHKVILHALASPLIVGGTVNLADLAIAVLVCERIFVEARALVFGDAWQAEVKVLAEQSAGANIEEALTAWRIYVANHTECPLHWSKDPDGEGDLRAPWEFHLVVFMADHMGRTEEEAWDTPVNLARCYYDVWSEQQGDKSLVTDREKQLMPSIGT